MSSNDPTRRLEWHRIDRHVLILRGASGAAVTLAAGNVLCQEGRVHEPAAIAFDIEVSLPHHSAPGLRLATSGGFYGDLDEVRRDLAAMRATAEGHAELFLEGLALRVAVRHHGARTGTIVEGTFSTLPPEVPFPPDEVRLLSRNGPDPAFQLSFAFSTSLIDPPLVDQFIEQVDALRAHLRLFAPD